MRLRAVDAYKDTMWQRCPSGLRCCAVKADRVFWECPNFVEEGVRGLVYFSRCLGRLVRATASHGIHVGLLDIRERRGHCSEGFSGGQEFDCAKMTRDNRIRSTLRENKRFLLPCSRLRRATHISHRISHHLAHSSCSRATTNMRSRTTNASNPLCAAATRRLPPTPAFGVRAQMSRLA